MTRFFNTAGPCRPDIHFMLPPARRVPEVHELVDRRSYFVIHAPRQSGKTTALRALAAELTAEGRYAAAVVSTEGGAPFGDDPGAAEGAFLGSFRVRVRAQLPPELQPPPWPAAEPGHRVGAALAAWAEACPRPIVLFIDEIDALRDDALLSVLRQLRDGYDERPQAFPSSIALVGLRDVRDYKIASGGSSRLGTSSPFNILAKSLTLRAFTRDEIAELYAQHTAETGQPFDPAAVDRAFDLSRGQPWLVNALAATAVDELARDRSAPVTAAHIDQAKERLILSRVTHLDSLADKLREDRVRRVIEPVLAGQEVGVEVGRDDIDYVTDLGLIARDAAGNLAIANPIYREVIPREIASVTADVMVLPARSWALPDGRLDVDGLFDAFVAFWRRHAEPMVRGQSYPEIAPHIVLMAYLQRVVNGGAVIEREYAAGSGRMDLCIRWPLRGGEQLVAIELKVWREKQGDPIHEGLSQIEGYLGKLGLTEGFLVIFDRRRSAEEVPWDERPRWETEDLAGGKRVRVLRL
jgi:type II secretory pathway predicted ATPase ExeA